MLIAEYLLSQRKEKNLLHDNGAFVKTIVSTNMADAIAAEYNVKLIEVLTGFKYIGEQIKFFEQQVHTNMNLVLKKAMAALSVHMQEIRMQLLPLWHYVKQQHTTRQRT